MKRDLFLGWTRDRVQQRIIQHIASGESQSLLYFLPTSQLLQEKREQIAIAQGKGIAGLKAVTFNDIITDILIRGGVKSIRLSKEGRQGLLQHVLYSLVQDGALPEYEQVVGFPGIVKALGKAIGEIKWSGCTPEQFLKLVQRYNVSNELDNLKPLARIYSKYQELLINRGEALLGTKGMLTDSEEEYWLAIEALEKLSQQGQKIFPQVELLIIEEYNDFNQLQLAILDKLISQVPQVEIYLPLAKVHSTFNHLEEQRQDTIKWLIERQFTLYPREEALSVVKGTVGAIQHLGEELYQLQPRRVSAMDQIKVQGCRNITKELTWIAKEIKKLLESEAGLGTKEICVVIPGLEDYRGDVTDVFHIEELPCNLTKSTQAQLLPMFKELFSLLGLVYGDWTKKELLKIAQAGYFSFSNRPTARFSHIIMQTAFARSMAAWVSRLTGQLKTGAEDQNQLQESIRFVKELGSLVEPFNSAQRMASFCQHMRELLQILGVAENLQRLLTCAEYSHSLYQRDLQFLQLLYETLEQLEHDAMILGLDNNLLSPKDFIQQLAGYLEEKQVSWEQGPRNGVQVLEPASAQGLTFTYVFIAGLNQGRWPKGQRENWLLGDEFRYYLEREKFGLPASAHLEEMEQRQFAHCVLLPQKGLYLTYQTGGDKGSLLPSPFIEEVQRVFQEEEWESDFSPYYTQAQLWPTWEEVSNYQQVKSIFGNEKLFSQKELPSWFFEHVPHWARLGELVQIEQERQLGLPTVYQGNLMSQDVHKLLQSEFNQEQVYSASFFNDYANCPFMFLCKRILKIDLVEEVDEELTPMDVGVLAHQILQELYHNYQGVAYRDIDLEQATTKLKHIIDSKRKTLESQPLGQRITFLFEWQEIEDKIINFVVGDIRTQQQASKNLSPGYLELVFGRSEYGGEAVVINSPEEEQSTIEVRGAIDRVDVTPEGDYIIYDYKSSTASKKGLVDLVNGSDFQLLIYLMALEITKPTVGKALGAAYYSLADNQRTKGIWLKEAMEQLGVNGRSGVIEEDWSQVINNSLNQLFNIYGKMRTGTYKPQPTAIHSCDYCNYSSICRYDKVANLLGDRQQGGGDCGPGNAGTTEGH